MLGAVILAVVGVGLVAWLARQARAPDGSAGAQCPACAGPVALLVPLEDEAARRSYEVLGCATCRTAVATVHGVPNSWAYCPACYQRTLHLAWEVLADGPDELEVAVEERCHLCGHEDVAQLWLPNDADDHRGQVIPFPQRRLRAGDG